MFVNISIEKIFSLIVNRQPVKTVYATSMSQPIAKKNLYTSLIYRPFWVTVASLLIILVIALTVLINTSWHALHQTKPLNTHLALTDALLDYNAKLDKQASKYSPQQLAQLELALSNTLHNSSKIISDKAGTSLQLALNTLQTTQTANQANISLAQKEIRAALAAETKIQTRLLHQLTQNNHLELKTATFVAIALPLLGLLMLFFLRHRILRPLNNLNLLINRLGQQAPSPVPLESVAPLLKPLFADFNNMLQRLSKLERERHQYQQKLEKKVFNATQSLLEYHQSLAQSERLAIVGELTAKLAHELRNPLAGIHLALANLSNEIEDEDKASRLTLVINELDRITQLLNQVLDQSRHSPEPVSQFPIAEVLSSLLQLVRYQIPARINIEQHVPPTLQCCLPEGRLRQVLLNIILNAAQAIGNNPGNITIDIKAHEKTLNICIQNDGPAFPENLLENNIQTFATSRDDGTGLGLAIVRRFCLDHGGTLTLSNPPAGGARIEIILPRRT